MSHPSPHPIPTPHGCDTLLVRIPLVASHPLVQVRRLKERSVVQREGAVLSAERKLREVQVRRCLRVCQARMHVAKMDYQSQPSVQQRHACRVLFAADAWYTQPDSIFSIFR